MSHARKTRNAATRPTTLERRDFLAWTGAAATVVAVGGCGARMTQGAIVAGPPADFAQGAARQIEGEPVLVFHDEGGLYAMSALCTHMGCTVSVEADRLLCPCHGAVYDRQGAVLEGPAREPLQHYSVVVDERGVVVDTTAPCSPEERAPLEG